MPLFLVVTVLSTYAMRRGACSRRMLGNAI